MGPGDKEFEEFLFKQFRDSGDFGFMPEESLRELVRAIIDIEEIETDSFEEIARRETNALFARCGVKGFEE